MNQSAIKVCHPAPPPSGPVCITTDDILGAVERLYDKLGPLLRPAAPVCSTPATENRSPIGSKLHQAHESLDDIYNRLDV